MRQSKALQGTISALLILLMPGLVQAATPAPGQSDSPLVPVESTCRYSLKDNEGQLIPPASVLEANGAIVGNITVVVKDIFDPDKPKESGWFYRTINTLHHNTRESTVSEFLLFNTGDLFSGRLLAETERLLRSERFLINALICPVRYQNNTVDIRVVTTDVWTLGISFNFSREGGENQRSFELRESNFLGYGKEVRLRNEENVDRTERTFRYFDPHLANNHSQLTLEYSDNSDGLVKIINLSRPFFSLDSRWSYEASYELTTANEKIYKNGEISQEFNINSEYYNFSLGLSKGLVDRRTKRFSFGFNVERDLFSPNQMTVLTDAIPDDRVLVYPYLKFESIENDFITTRRLNFINRTEDLNLGKEYSLQIGWSDKSWHANSNSVLFDGEFSMSYIPRKKHMYLSSINFAGRYTEGSTDNLTIESETRYYYPLFQNQVFHYMLNMEYGHNLDLDNQIFLGGSSGLRGYPLRLQQGDRKILFTAEHRFYSNWHVLQLVHVGAAVFFDIGRAWSSNTPSLPNNKILKDVGLGLRITSSRAGKGKVLHMDMAWPLDGDDSIEDVQFKVGTEGTF